MLSNNFSFFKTKLNTKKRMSTKTFMSIISSETIFRTPKKSIEYKSKSLLASFMPDFTSTPNNIIPKTSTPDIKVKEKPTKLRRIKKKTIDKKKKKYDLTHLLIRMPLVFDFEMILFQYFYIL